MSAHLKGEMDQYCIHFDGAPATMKSGTRIQCTQKLAVPTAACAKTACRVRTTL